MKRFVTFFITFVFCIACFGITVNAAAREDIVLPMYNNTAVATTTFNINENGVASVSVSYGGKYGQSVSAVITSKIQKNESGTWVDVDIDQPNNQWVDESSMSFYSTTHTHQLTSRGTYRAVVVYEISGTGGATDVIERTIEKTY